MFRTIAAVAACAALLMTQTACGDSPTGPSGSASVNRTDVRAGTGAEAAQGSVISVHYTGWFYNPDRPNNQGAQFDSSRGGEPFTFALGVGQVIPGWDQGIVGMRVGGVRRIVIPPSLAYGSVRNSSIPPNATLLFEVELLEVR